MECVDKYGPNRASLSDVANALGVTRQTVYRYFGGTDELFAAVARTGADVFLDRLTLDVANVTDPADAVVEAVARAVEWLPTEPYLGLVLIGEQSNRFLSGATSAEAMELARQLLESLPICWSEWGLGSHELDLLAEFGLRMIQSLVLDPQTRARDPEDLRRFLRFWVRAALCYSGESCGDRSLAQLDEREDAL
jgi:AcrR family transcriptional regulator